MTCTWASETNPYATSYYYQVDDGCGTAYMAPVPASPAWETTPTWSQVWDGYEGWAFARATTCKIVAEAGSVIVMTLGLSSLAQSSETWKRNAATAITATMDRVAVRDVLWNFCMAGA